MNAKAVVRYCLLITVLGLSSLSNAQQSERKNSVYLGIGSYMISQNSLIHNNNEYKPIKEFRPTIDVSYNRLIWKGLSAGLGYSYKISDPNAHLADWRKIQCTAETNALIFSISYKISIKAFNITPYIAIGPASVYLNFDEHTYFENGRYNTCMTSSGIRLGYDIKRFTLYMSYNFDHYKVTSMSKKDIIVPAILAFPSTFVNYCLKIGLGWSI